VDGASAAVDFHVRVFGARETARYTEGSDRLGYAELSFGGHECRDDQGVALALWEPAPGF
jgi:uncharacterized glyoxalase superfamily protein PhnB